ncbi:NAD(P)-dependent dehydrogenase (short-subunit alcohol dehydrogenase family) [Halomonas ventosae]|uniref:NAD(P)-dependent dehydrogenase (Short-subunit alcohol dehydrogenase family) n=1 Tax=Halomonas ventosae TaxID=229007 RepID=A0A4R6ZXE2_9GAMM|nr:SDR family oxidoreductase [Halomonas ventosae]TDR57252.1 NAD(P)-dependent dehydrogenase (short-subunit alcohol dehydrogenase family) [Halomonas ventosae]
MSSKLQQHFSLQGKQVLVTGATGYLGRAMALGLAELGAHVLINGRCHERVMERVAKLRETGLTASPAVFDINNEAEVDKWFSECCSSPLHGIVNNAYAGGAGSIETAVESDYRNSYEVSLVSAHRILRHGLPCLRSAISADGAASVVNIGSMYGMVSPDQRVYEDKRVSNPPFYGAAKAALLQWTRYAACEFGSEGIRINAISPGPFPSEDVQEGTPEFVVKLAARVPLGRVGRADEIQGPLAFLISDASSFVNGANLVVDGGWTCW